MNLNSRWLSYWRFVLYQRRAENFQTVIRELFVCWWKTFRQLYCIRKAFKPNISAFCTSPRRLPAAPWRSLLRHPVMITLLLMQTTVDSLNRNELTSNMTFCWPFSNSPNSSKTSSFGFWCPNFDDSALNECRSPSTLLPPSNLFM